MTNASLTDQIAAELKFGTELTPEQITQVEQVQDYMADNQIASPATAIQQMTASVPQQGAAPGIANGGTQYASVSGAAVSGLATATQQEALVSGALGAAQRKVAENQGGAMFDAAYAAYINSGTVSNDPTMAALVQSVAATRPTGPADRFFDTDGAIDLSLSGGDGNLLDLTCLEPVRQSNQRALAGGQ